MKKVLCLILCLFIFGVIKASAADFTPVKFSVFDPISFPSKTVVKGVELGLVGASESEIIYGIQDVGIWGYVSKKLYGIQGGLTVKAEALDGVQNGFVARCGKMQGLQSGFVSIAKEVTGVQLGIINYTRKMKGVQVGVFNIIVESPLPIFVGVNASF